MPKKTAKKRTTKKKTAKRKTTKRKKVARKRSSSGQTKGAAQEELIRSILKKDPEATNEKLRSECAKARNKYGALNLNRAAQIRIEMGISKRRRRGAGRKKGAAVRRPGRPRKMASPVDAVQAVLARMRELEREASQLRAALDKIGKIVGNL